MESIKFLESYKIYEIQFSIFFWKTKSYEIDFAKCLLQNDGKYSSKVIISYT